MSIHEGYAAAQRASDHADRVHQEPLFSKIAWIRMLQYLAITGQGGTFTTERFRAWAHLHSVPQAPDERAFGNVTRKAARKGLIVDSKERVKEGSHGREVVLWRVV